MKKIFQSIGKKTTGKAAAMFLGPTIVPGIQQALNKQLPNKLMINRNFSIYLNTIIEQDFK